MSRKQRRKHDPFNIYGYGILAYFRIHIRLIKFLFIISLTMGIPLMGLMGKTNKYDATKSFFQRTTFVNVQRAQAVCKQQFLGLNHKLKLECPDGIFTGHIFHYGVMPKVTPELVRKLKAEEVETWGFDMCGNITNTDLKSKYNCAKYSDKTIFEKAFKSECLHKESCELEHASEYLPKTIEDEDQEQKEKCTGDTAYMYM